MAFLNYKWVMSGILFLIVTILFGYAFWDSGAPPIIAYMAVTNDQVPTVESAMEQHETALRIFELMKQKELRSLTAVDIIEIIDGEVCQNRNSPISDLNLPQEFIDSRPRMIHREDSGVLIIYKENSSESTGYFYCHPDSSIIGYPEEFYQLIEPGLYFFQNLDRY